MKVAACIAVLILVAGAAYWGLRDDPELAFDLQINDLHALYVREHLKVARFKRTPLCDAVRFQGRDKLFRAAVTCIRSYDREGLEHADGDAHDALLAAQRTLREEHYGNGVPQEVIGAARLKVDLLKQAVEQTQLIEAGK